MTTKITAHVHYDPDDRGTISVVDVIEGSGPPFGVIRMGSSTCLVIKTSKDAYALLNDVDALAHKLTEAGR